MATPFASLAKAALIDELKEMSVAVRDLAANLSEKELWTKPIEPGNSVGHLLLHLTGNLNHFVGAKLGKTNYVRDREREFTEANPPSKKETIAGLDVAVNLFQKVVSGLSEEQLLETHPETRFGQVYKALIHIVAHFAIHRGQMTYIARLVSKK